MAGFVLAATCFAQGPEKRLAPYVVSPQLVVDQMLAAAGVRPGELVYDLGCGDGRVVITAAQRFGAKSVGVELKPDLVRAATDQIKKLGLQNRARVIQGDLMEVDISDADVVVLYLMTLSNDLVRPKLEKSLRAGARVVSHDFKVPGWKPKAVEKTEAFNRVHTIYVYTMPPEK
jgi:predicted RNA methylase